MKTRSFLMMLFIGLFAFAMTVAPSFVGSKAGMAVAADEWADEGEEEDAFGNIMETTFATIDKVEFAAPVAGAPCNVTAKVSYPTEEESAKIKSVKIVYYVNGDLSKGTEVEMTGAADTYTGAIPGQGAGSKIDFIIRVEDTVGNISSQAVSGGKALVAAVSDIDNSPDIVADDADLLALSAGYDDKYLYVDYTVQGAIKGGTIDPPYIQLYGIKITNPDTDSGEGLMVGKLWVNLPLARDKAVQDSFIKPLLMGAGAEYVEKMGKEKVQKALDAGMLVLDIQKLMGGAITEGLLFSSEPEGTTDAGKFSGKILRAPLGDNPSGALRVIVLTAANASKDSFMPIPLNCTNFITIYTASQSYEVK